LQYLQLDKTVKVENLVLQQLTNSVQPINIS